MSEADILAITAIVMSAASLAWQAATWRWSGAAIQAWFTIDEDVMIVTAYNSGRSAATVTGVSVDIDVDIDRPAVIDRTPMKKSDPIPHRIEAGGYGLWRYKIGYVSERSMRRARSGLYFNVYRAKVTVGGNKIVTAIPERWLRDGRG